MSLRGRCGLVVGVSSERSLGFACLERLCGDGAEVLATYRPRPSREGLPERLASVGCELSAPMDVRVPEDVDRVMAVASARWGRLDFIVHTIVHVPDGVLSGPLTAVTREDFSGVVADAAHSLVTLCAAARPLLTASGQAAVVSMTSESSHLVTPNYHVAGIAKAALEATVRYLAFELGGAAVTCNAVSAPAISTDGADATIGQLVMRRTEEHLAKSNMVRRAVGARDVADAVAFLVSDRARQVTAQVWTVDGGFSRLYF